MGKNFDGTEFREKLSSAIKAGTVGAIDTPDLEEEYGEVPTIVEAPEEVSSPAPSVSEAPPTPSAPSYQEPAEPPSWFKSYIEQDQKRSDALLQSVLTRTGPAPQEVANTGVQQQVDDSYFMNRGEFLQAIRPLADQTAWVKQTLSGFQETRVVEDYNRAERLFKEKYGEDFDKVVNPDLRAKALENARAGIKNGRAQEFNWDALFQEEYDRNEAPLLRAKLSEIQEAKRLEQEQQAELKKVSGMPKGNTAHQAPVAPKKRQPGEGRFESFRSNVQSMLRARRAEA